MADPAALDGLRAGSSPTRSTSSRCALLAADAPEAASYGVSQRLNVNARAAGPRLGKDVQHAIKGSKSGDWSVAEDGTVTAGGLALEEGEYTLETVAGSADDGTATGVLPRRRLRRARHRGHRRSWPPRAWPATWSAPSSRPAATPASTSPTGSR